MSLDDWEIGERRRYDARYGPPSRYLPRRIPEPTETVRWAGQEVPVLYSRGIGHTGLLWPRGRGHDWCWAPFDCISCGCGPEGPGDCHRNEAALHGW